jgi:hypothetical protein
MTKKNGRQSQILRNRTCQEMKFLTYGTTSRQIQRLKLGDVPSETLEVTPAEWWAAFSAYPTPHKLIGNLGHDIQDSLGYEPLQSYLETKHNLNEAKLSQTNLSPLGRYLRGLKPHHLASTIKLMHGWIHTYDILCRQGRLSSSLCLQCSSTVETINHFLQCPWPATSSARVWLSQSFLTELEKMGQIRCFSTSLISNFHLYSTSRLLPLISKDHFMMNILPLSSI